jgi:shikimate dehydrogenase
VSSAVSRYAVVGHPVAHSQSPFIHAAFAAQTGEPVVYERLLCPLDGFTAAVREFAAGGASGCNVTMPFKFEAFERVAKTTPRARIAAACNTLRFDADGWLGDNTDGAGLVRDIERNAGVDLRGARILLIGAGGGAAGALGPLLASGASEVVVANRSVDKARALVDRHCEALGGAARRASSPRARRCGEGFDVVVNATATSVAGAAVPVAPSVLRRGGLAST